MIRWTPDQIARALDAEVLGPLPPEPVEGLSTDTRSMTHGCAFLALKGPVHDAHDYLEQAIERGARLLIIHDASRLPRERITERNVGVLRVSETTDALHRLAHAYRSVLPDTRVIGVTGSNGKTTTVRLLDAVLSTALSGSLSPKSYNNHIGVPLTILSATPDDAYLISEIGMNAPGEIEPLTRLLRPDIAIITSIGRAHIGALGSREAIAREKCSILAGLSEDGLGIINTESTLAQPLIGHDPRVRWFGRGPSPGVRVLDVETDGSSRTRFSLDDASTWEIPLPGEHQALNACACILCARALGLDDATIAQGLRSFAGVPMRFEGVQLGTITLYNDAYNASPESVRAALDTFHRISRGTHRRSVVVLADMAELGEHSSGAHNEVLSHARSLGFDRVLAIGPSMSHARPGADASWPSSDQRALQEAAGELRADDVVLLKGSRSFGLERLIPIIRSLPTGAP